MLTHICAADEWRVAEGLDEHRPGSLAAMGFVHLSTPEQVHLPANRLYAGRTDLVLLHIDPAFVLIEMRSDPEPFMIVRFEDHLVMISEKQL